MPTRRQAIGGGLAAVAALSGAYSITAGERPLGRVASGVAGAPMDQQFAMSPEFKRVTWSNDGWITIRMRRDAKGQSLALAAGRVADPFAGDHVSANLTGGAVEFGLGEAIANREMEAVSIGSYRIDPDRERISPEQLDVVVAGIPDPVLERRS